MNDSVSGEKILQEHLCRKAMLAMAAMGQPETKVGKLCREMGITRQTLYRHVAPNGSIRGDGKKLLGKAGA